MKKNSFGQGLAVFLVVIGIFYIIGAISEASEPNDCMSTLWRTGIRKCKEVCALRCNIDTRREEVLHRMRC